MKTQSRDIMESADVHIKERCNQHASLTRDLLREAQRIIETFDFIRGGSDLQRSRIKPVSPLAQLNDIDVASQHCKTSRLRIYSLAANGTCTQQGPESAMINCYSTPRVVPKFQVHASVKTNVLSENNEILRYVPYFEDEVPDGIEDLGHHFEDWTEDLPKMSYRREQAEWLLPIVTGMTMDFGCSPEQVLRALLKRTPSSRKKHIPAVKAIWSEENEWTSWQLQGLTAKLSKSKNAKAFVKSWKTSSIRPLRVRFNPEQILITDPELAALVTSLDLSPVPKAPDDTAETFRASSLSSLRCAICFRHKCLEHGEYLGNNSLRQFIAPPQVFSSSAQVRKPSIAADAAGAAQGLESETPCSEECFLKDRWPEAKLCEWPEDLVSLLKSTLPAWRDCKTAPCLYSWIVARPCNEIHAKIQQLLSQEGSLPSEASMKLGVKKIDFTAVNTSQHEKRRPFIPCNHPGPCMKNTCSCFDQRVACEKSCRCRNHCWRAFRGCSCKRKGKVCQTSRCECVSTNRECDPDLCSACGAAEVLDLANCEDDSAPKPCCRNVGLQRGIPKRTLLGVSEVEGYGLFMGEAVKAEEFLGEYVGEVLSSGEAERRGAIYHLQKLSYLFDLNKGQTVDATRVGNKFRFINHSALATNCAAKVLFVNGVQRIGMFATRDIEPGEELYFDYGLQYHKTLLSKEPKSKMKQTGAGAASQEPAGTSKAGVTSTSAGQPHMSAPPSAPRRYPKHDDIIFNARYRRPKSSTVEGRGKDTLEAVSSIAAAVDSEEEDIDFGLDTLDSEAIDFGGGDGDAIGLPAADEDEDDDYVDSSEISRRTGSSRAAKRRHVNISPDKRQGKRRSARLKVDRKSAGVRAR